MTRLLHFHSGRTRSRLNGHVREWHDTRNTRRWHSHVFESFLTSGLEPQSVFHISLVLCTVEFEPLSPIPEENKLRPMEYHDATKQGLRQLNTVVNIFSPTCHTCSRRRPEIFKRSVWDCIETTVSCSVCSTETVATPLNSINTPLICIRC